MKRAPQPLLLALAGRTLASYRGRMPRVGLEHHGAGVWLGAEVQALQEALWGMYGEDCKGLAC